MCNNVRLKSRKIKSTGLGYKVFRRWDKNKLSPPTRVRTHRYTANKDGWISWNKPREGDGFCIFKHKKDAERYARSMFVHCTSAVVVRILYAEALAIQRGIMNMDVIIAKEFLLPEYVEGEYV